jgi:hypothetical protein
MEAVHGAATLLGQLITAVGQKPQDGSVVLLCDLTQRAVVQGDSGDRHRVEDIRLPTVARVQDAGSCSQLGGNVNDGLTRTDELLRKEEPKSTGALDSPHALRPRRGPVEELTEHLLVRRDAEL